MAAEILDGKAIAKAVRDEVRTKVETRRVNGQRQPGLAVVLVGEDTASRVYVTKKREDCAEVGFISEEHKLPANITQADLLGLVDRLNDDPRIDGILVQLPLPDHLDPQQVIDRINPHKDVDGFHPQNIGRLALRLPGLRSCTPHGIMTLLRHTDVELEGKDAVIVGQSNIVGRPMALELLNARCTITVCHSRTRDLAEKVAGADIVVAAVGRPRFIQGDWVKAGAVVIDVGINRGDDGKLIGDVDYAGAAERAAWITPVPDDPGDPAAQYPAGGRGPRRQLVARDARCRPGSIHAPGRRRRHPGAVPALPCGSVLEFGGVG